MIELNWTAILVIDGEEFEADITAEECVVLKRGLDTGSPFAFSSDGGNWNWVNPDRVALVCIEEKS